MRPVSGRSRPRRPPTIRDVASRARVSAATVSRVLNESAGVRPALRDAVRRATRALRFVRDGVARSLARGRTRTLGLIVADLTDPFYAGTAKAIADAARGRGYTVVLCNTDNLHGLQAEQIDMLHRQQVDGILLGSVHLSDPPVERLVRAGFPCVMFNRRLASGAGTYVVLDNVRGAEEATRHFLTLGHRRIGFIARPRDFSTAAERLAGYRRAPGRAPRRTRGSSVRATSVPSWRTRPPSSCSTARAGPPPSWPATTSPRWPCSTPPPTSASACPRIWPFAASTIPT